MRRLDRVLQRWRIRQAARHIANNARVLDIGCADGALLRALDDRVRIGVGVDPDAVPGPISPRIRLFRGRFPAALPDAQSYDVICLLAVLEHVAESEQRTLAADCANCLVPGGRVIATVPAPVVDHLLSLLRTVRLIDGMSLEQHYGFDPAQLPERFVAAGFRLLRHTRFQFGLNHLFIFERSGRTT